MNNAFGTPPGIITKSNRDKAAGLSESGGMQRIRFGDLLMPLQTAAKQGQSWLSDFSNDDVMLPPDLVDVIQTFARMQAEKKRGFRVD